jgi:hypothetical protein
MTDFIVFRIYSYKGFCSDPLMGASSIKRVADQKTLGWCARTAPHYLTLIVKRPKNTPSNGGRAMGLSNRQARVPLLLRQSDWETDDAQKARA